MSDFDVRTSMRNLFAFGAITLSCAANAQQPGSTPAAPTKAAVPAVTSGAAPTTTAARPDFAGLNRYATDNAALPTHQDGRVIFYGDSITEAWAKSPNFFSRKPYLGRGISGHTTPQMLIRFRQDVINLHPAAVVILAGTNDIAGNQGSSTLEMIENNLQSMAELGKANGIKVILSSVLPVKDYPWRRGLEPAEKIKALNTWIANYCVSQQLVYLDYYSALADADGGMKPGLSKDGVHPSPEGYAMMEPLAEKAIETALHQTDVRE